ncbi:MAG: cardiolipin synthase [Muribaculaceae bacterium]|nr:cardiolipin synthase [Muribaculaceae bacterium]
MSYGYIVFIVFTILYVITIISAIVVVISENRNPVKSLAWVTVLIALPFIGLILYLFFGRSLRGVHMISRRNRLKLRAQSNYEPVDKDSLNLTDDSKQLIKLVNTVVEPHVFVDNEVEIFTSGEEKFAALKRDLINAKKYIHLQYYIIACDKIGREIRDILVEKAQQGVKVRVIYDHIGSFLLYNSFFKKMRKQGVEAYPFLKVTITELANRLNWRNHRKMVIIDGEIGYLGGMNIADRYVTGTAKRPAWRDTHLRITGDAVKGLQYSFAVDWNFMKRSLLTEPIPPREKKTQQHNAMQIVSSGPTGMWNGISIAFLKTIASAKKCVYIQTPYFLPNDGLLKALQTVALAKADVRLMVPRNPDSKLLKYASYSYIKECLLAGIKVYFYENRMMHSKCVIIDDEIVSTGSTNFDFRSFEHNFECNAMIYDKDFSARMKAVFAADQRNCTRINISHWRRRPRRQRALESLARMFSPIL